MVRHEKGDKSPSSSSVSTESMDRAPDGGWGWAVCFGSFLANFILDGTMFSFGVLLLELLHYFGEGKSKTSWIGSSLLGMSMLMGPIVSILLEKYTCRQITIVGTMISVVAFVISTFSPNVEMLIITYGIIGGVGFSMSFISAIIIVGLYFNRKRAIATGIAMSGSGLGTFTYAYLTEYLIGEYDWRGTILILSGILLNGVVCGMLFRPLEDNCSRSNAASSESIANHKQVNDVEELKTLLSSKKFNTLINHKREFSCFEPTKLPARLTMSTDLVRVQKELAAETFDIREFSSQQDCRDRKTKASRNQMSKCDVLYSGSLTHLHGNHTSRMLSSHQLDCAVPVNSPVTSGSQCTTGYLHVLKSNCALFKDKIFVLLLLTNVCWTVQSVPLTYIPDLAVSKSLPTSQAAILISIVGITNIIGRILSGVITDVFQIKSTVMYIIALFAGSVVNFIFPWCNTFPGLAACSAVFGLCMATAVSMRTIVLADHLGMDRLTKSFGMVALFQGIAFMTNAPLGGFLYETYDSYIMPFSFAGLMYFFSAIFCLAVQCLDHGRTLAYSNEDITVVTT